MAIIVFQSFEVGDDYGRVADTPAWVVPGWSVAAVFALAGYAAMRGLARDPLPTVLARATLRLLPALALTVVATVVLGAFETDAPPARYTTTPATALYLLNIAGLPHFVLPGVFATHPSARVTNELLGIVPAMYLAAGTAVLSRLLRPAIVLVCVGAAVAILGAIVFVRDPETLATGSAFGAVLVGRGLLALLAFVAGASIFHARTRVRRDVRLAVLAAAGLLAVALAGNRSTPANVPLALLVVAPIAYLTLYLATSRLPLRHVGPGLAPLLWRCLLCAYPIQQAWVGFGPARHGAAVNLLLSLPVIVLVAGGEWFLIERPLLRWLLPARLVPTFVLSTAPRPTGAKVRSLRARLRLRLRRRWPLVVSVVLLIAFVLVAFAMTMLAFKPDGAAA